MAIRVNMAIGDVNGIKEQIFIAILSIVPLDMETTTITKAAINKKSQNKENQHVAQKLYRHIEYGLNHIIIAPVLCINIIE